MLTQERLKELLDYDPETGVFVWKVRRGRVKAGGVAGYKMPVGYIYLQIDGIPYYAHRLAWFYTYGAWPAEEIDHINRVRHDNSISNLRDIAHIKNLWNSHRRGNSTGFTGVYWSKEKEKYYSQIRAHYVCKHLGYFDTPEAANAAYMAAKSELHNI